MADAKPLRCDTIEKKTPLKSKMEPEHTPLEKEKHLQTTIFWGSKVQVLPHLLQGNGQYKPSGILVQQQQQQQKCYGNGNSTYTPED